jgi:tripartite-type tricarboxylate transporter receptor subunit TctC
MAKIDVVHVPFRASSQVLQELLAGRVQLAFESVPGTLPFLEDGKLYPLGTSARARLAELPNVPPVADSLPGFEAAAGIYLTAPKDTPTNVISLVNDACNQALKHPAFLEQLRKLGLAATGGTPQQLEAMISSERKKWKALIEVLGLAAQ